MRRALTLGAAVVGALLGTETPQAQDPVFKARVDGVRVDVLVTERGRPLPGLGPGDFDVRDSGVPQTIELVSLGDVPVGVMLVLDLSASVRGQKLEALRRAGLSLVDALAPGDTGGLITFTTTPFLHAPLGAPLDDLRAALRAVQPVGHTALVDAALSAMLLGDADGGRTLIMVFSDGVDTASFTRPSFVLEAARRMNGVVYGVATAGSDAGFLRELANATGGRVVDLERDADPSAAFLDILREFRRRYVITFTPTGVTPGGWHPLQIRVNRGNVRVQARPGYTSAAR